MKNRFINFVKVYKPLLITFGVVLLVAVILGLTCVGVATMDTSGKLAHADSWVPSTSANTITSPISLGNFVNEDNSPGLWFNMSEFFNASSGLDRYLQYFVEPYSSTSTVRNYFQTIGYIYGAYSSKATGGNSSVYTPGELVPYCLAVGLRLQERYNSSNDTWSVNLIDIGTMSGSYVSNNMLYISNRVNTQLGVNYDWRLSESTYSLGTENSVERPSYIDYYINGDSTWVKYPSLWRNIGNGLTYPNGISIQGYVPNYSQLNEDMRNLYGGNPINGFGSNADTIVVELRSFLSRFMSFGLSRSILISDNYDLGFQDGRDVGFDEGYDEGFDEGFDEGRNEGFDEGYADGKYDANNTVTTTSASYNAGYNYGVESASTFTFNSLMSAVFDVPVRTLLSMLNFEILGVDMSAFFLSLITICVVLFVIRLIMGR